MNFPNFDQGRALMQNANLVHSVGAVLYIAMMLGHIYLGTIGAEGVYQTMRHDGLVDETWAKHHHELWYKEVMAEQRNAGTGAGGSLPAGARAQRL